MLPLALSAACTSPPSTAAAQAQAGPAAKPEPSAPTDNLPQIAADPRERTLAEVSSVLLSTRHLLRRPIDDTLSTEAFPKYLEELDGAKLLLLQEHVTALTAYASRMDDELRAHDLVLARKGSAVAAQRRQVVAKMVVDILAKPIDFTVAGEVETDPKKLDFCKTEDELRERWRSVLTLQALERIQQMESLLEAKDAHKGGKKSDHKGGKKGEKKDTRAEQAAAESLASIPTTPEAREEKARKELATRYETRFLRLATPEPLEPDVQFLNAITAVYDPHTQYLAPAEKENFDIAISGTLQGIGALLGERDHYIVVQELVPGGAAWTQGKLEAGDLIISVTQTGKAAVDATDMPIDKVVEMIRGPKGTVVTLTVKKAEGDIQSIAITRDVVKIEAAYARGAVLDLGRNADPVGYIYLPGFYGDIGAAGQPGERNATDDVRALLTAFQKKKLSGVIVDLRGNGGGLLSHARDISGLFVDKGPIVQARDAEGSLEVLSDEDPSVAFTGNAVVLVDRFSASASEIVAGALQDYERAVIVGTGPTHGKGTVQGVVELDRIAPTPGRDSLGVLKLTVQQYFRVNGASTQLRGVVPDVTLPDPASFVESGERTLFHPIPWSSVAELAHARTPHTWNVQALAAASRERVKASPVFAKVEAFGKILREQRDDTREPLERSAWKAERERQKAAQDAADPKLKEHKPLFEVDVVAAAGAPAPVTATQDKDVRARLDAWKDDLSRDVWVEESLRVLVDMAGKR
ncbi:MAG TPA: carboxy terminal-processing peptidase [Kofleriaceae bacterium]|nr:carboxy terminal-processing peptidase [Kofleriaceae bacterium]